MSSKDSNTLNDYMFNNLKEIIEIPSPSGFEHKIQLYIKDKIKKYVDNVKMDVMGNLIGVRNPNGYPKIMLMAHCDEVGFMISYISNEGLLYFKPIGKIDEHLTLGKRVIIHSRNGPILGENISLIITPIPDNTPLPFGLESLPLVGRVCLACVVMRCLFSVYFRVSLSLKNVGRA